MDFTQVKSFFIDGKEVIKACIGDTVVWAKTKLLKSILGNSIQFGEPTPDTPSDVFSVGERTANLLDATATGYENGVYVSTSTGLEEYSSSYYCTDFIPVQAGKSYTHTITGLTAHWLYDADKNPIIKVSVPSTSSTVTVPEGCYYLRFNVKNVTLPNRLMCNEGDTLFDYEPYGYKIPVKVISSVNFYNPNKVKLIEGYYISSTGIEKFDINWYITDYIQITGTSFILHKNSTTGVAPSICLYDKDKNFITGVNYNRNDDIIISAKDTNKIPAYARFTIYKPQVEKVITLSEYNQTDIYIKEPLRKVGEYADEVTPSGIIRRVIEWQLDGKTAGRKLTSSGSASYFVRGVLSNLKTYIPNLKPLSSTRSILMSNQYQYSSSGTISATAFLNNSSGIGQLYIVHSDQTLTTVDSLNEQLAIDKPTFYFPIEDTLDTDFSWKQDIEVPQGATITFGTTVQPSNYILE